MRLTRLRISLVLSLLLVAALAVPAVASGDDKYADGDTGVRFERVQQRLIGVFLPDTFVIVLPDGTTVTEEPAEDEESPPVGTELYFSHDLYLPAEDDPEEPSGDVVGRTQVTCTALVRDDLRCFVDARVDGVGELHHTTLFTFEDDEDAEFFLEAAITGGSGAFNGATGQTTITQRADFEESNVEFFDVDAVLPVAD